MAGFIQNMYGVSELAKLPLETHDFVLDQTPHFNGGFLEYT